MMPDLGSQHHCTLYTFIVLGKVMYSHIFYDIVFYCIVVPLCSNILYCFNKRISVSPKPGMVCLFSFFFFFFSINNIVLKLNYECFSDYFCSIIVII